MTTFVLIFDIVAAVTFVVLMTSVNMDQKTVFSGGLRRLNNIRRIVYAVAASAIGYRVWDIIESGHSVSVPGAVVNFVLVGSLLALALGRIAWIRREE